MGVHQLQQFRIPHLYSLRVEFYSKVMREFEEKYPLVANKYFDLRYATRGSLNIPWEQEANNDE